MCPLPYAGFGAAEHPYPKSFLHPAMPRARGRLCADRSTASGLCGGGCAGLVRIAGVRVGGLGLLRSTGLRPSPRGLPPEVLPNFVKYFKLFLVTQGLTFFSEPIFLFAATRLFRDCHCNQFLFDRRFQVCGSEMLVVFQIENILEFSS